ncbi:MAG: DUF3618 domain-containing protein [Catenulispora sp.]|nr:DUF3618 domain-containing protein [Catenulispora sp.]
MSTQFESNSQDELRAHIAATRAELGETLEALASRTRGKARAKDAARDTASRVKIETISLPLRASSGIAALWRRAHAGYSSVPPNRRRLSIAAVLSGGAAALLAATRPWTARKNRNKGHCR